MDGQPLLHQKFYRPSEKRGWGKNTRGNGKQTFCQHESLLKYNNFYLCEVTAISVGINKYLPARQCS